MNTRIHYIYRDASNYKQATEVVVAGEIRFEEVRPYLDDGTWFIASQVGLEDLQLRWRDQGYKYPDPNGDDHVYCEFEGESDFELTEDEPTVELTADELRAAFQAVGGPHGWDVAAAMTRLDLPEDGEEAA